MKLFFERHFVILVAGLLFGSGLVVSGMVTPRRVIGFLDVTGTWDPTLIIVMFSAMAIMIPGHFIRLRMSKPKNEAFWNLPASTGISIDFVIGNLLFGMGWAFAGLCPGPLLASIGALDPIALSAVVSWVFGVAIVNLFKNNWATHLQGLTG